MANRHNDTKTTRLVWSGKELLAEQVSREEVGVAGAVLWYPSGVLPHAGIVAGVGDAVGHAGRYMIADAGVKSVKVPR
jgi:hypothetical protein